MSRLMWWSCVICNMVIGLKIADDKLYRSREAIKGLKPSEIALLQFDSRDLDNYWLTSAIWNDYYAKKHGHQFIYYSLTKGSSSMIVISHYFTVIIM